ncbi:MAG: hypothetical protein SGILL_007491, partial [Bacillariaceae sp.]
EIQDPIGDREQPFGDIRGTRVEPESDSSPISALERRDRLNLNDDTPKPDSVADFRSALNAGLREAEFDDEIHEGQHTTGNATADSWIKAFGGSSGGGAKRWMTAPSPGLATIQEDGGDDEGLDPVDETAESKPVGPLDQLSSEIHNKPKKTPVRQFRVPKRTAKSSGDDGSKTTDDLGNDSQGPFPPTGEELSFELVPPTSLPVDSPDKKRGAKDDLKKRGQTLPTTDADMIRAGSSFLDAIEKSLGLR